MADLTGEQPDRDDPGDPAAGRQGGVGELTHQADAAAPVDEVDAAAGQSVPGRGRRPDTQVSGGVDDPQNTHTARRSTTSRNYPITVPPAARSRPDAWLAAHLTALRAGTITVAQIP